ncbi:hypothetical protein JCM8097_000900 [Rhodosporidiobolus ruineniae]
MASAAVSHPPAPRTAPRHRPSRRERDLIRTQQQQHSPSLSTSELPLTADQLKHRTLDWLPLADSSTARTCPVVFSPDSSYAFVASGSAVKVYSVRTTELLSTLSVRPFASSSSSSSSGAATAYRRATVTAVLLSPSNPRQLVVGSSDAKLRVWDYLEGRLVRTLDMATPVVHAVANPALPDQVYVALAPADERTKDGAAAEAETKAQRKAMRRGGYADEKQRGGEQLAGVYLVSLRPAKADADAKAAAAGVDPATPLQPARRVRLAFPRAVRALALSPTGSVLASLTPDAVHLCRTAELTRGFSQTVAAVDAEELTTLAFHPTENYFATGNSKGQIRLWYNVLGNAAVGAEVEAGKEDDEADEGKTPSTALLHWHANAVSSLAFTPNGAYLLSGGQEAVLVLWQLHSGHQEYVPRLGAPILTLTVLENGESGEQQVAARLRDGSVVFVGSQKLKVVKTITGLKADTVAAPTSTSRSVNLATPLALDPSTSSLVLPAGHPSSIQFYSLPTDSQALELEVSPSNRVSSAGEPTRVERVAFSAPEEKNGGAYWMATLDSWASDGYAPVRQLKFWRKKADGSIFTLSTRIDRPQSAPLTSVTFSPSPTSPLLLTTATDGSIKVWAYHAAASSWRCRLSLTHRATAPVAAAWSHDGSLFAVAHLRSVTLWSVAGAGELVHSFPATSVGRPKSVEFVDQEGIKVLVTGTSGALGWDLLTLEETFSSAIDFSAAAPSSSPSGSKSSVFLATEDGDPSTLYLLDAAIAAGPSSSAAAVQTRPLPFPVRQVLPLPSTSASASAAADISLAVIDTAGSVALVGAAASSTNGGYIAPSRLPTSSTGAGATQPRLFDEIFGTADLALKAAMAGKGKGKAVEGADQPKLDSLLLETPAHSLPPVRLLWRELLAVAGRFEDDEAAKEEGSKGEKVVASVEQEQPRLETPRSAAFAPVAAERMRGIFGKRLGLTV